MLHVEIRQASPIALDARFSCDNGETLVLVGPSGSGKSTILKTIAGIYRPAAGRIELPLAWPGIVSALVMTIAHTVGEFGVVLMVGGNIPGETRTIAISIYDRVQAFDMGAAGAMSSFLLVFSLVTLALTSRLSRRVW